MRKFTKIVTTTSVCLLLTASAFSKGRKPRRSSGDGPSNSQVEYKKASSFGYIPLVNVESGPEGQSFCFSGEMHEDDAKELKEAQNASKLLVSLSATRSRLDHTAGRQEFLNNRNKPIVGTLASRRMKESEVKIKFGKNQYKKGVGHISVCASVANIMYYKDTITAASGEKIQLGVRVKTDNFGDRSLEAQQSFDREEILTRSRDEDILKSKKVYFKNQVPKDGESFVVFAYNDISDQNRLEKDAFRQKLFNYNQDSIKISDLSENEDGVKILPPVEKHLDGLLGAAYASICSELDSSEEDEANVYHINQDGSKSVFKCKSIVHLTNDLWDQDREALLVDMDYNRSRNMYFSEKAAIEVSTMKGIGMLPFERTNTIIENNGSEIVAKSCDLYLFRDLYSKKSAKMLAKKGYNLIPRKEGSSLLELFKIGTLQFAPAGVSQSSSSSSTNIIFRSSSKSCEGEWQISTPMGHKDPYSKPLLQTLYQEKVSSGYGDAKTCDKAEEQAVKDLPSCIEQ